MIEKEDFKWGLLKRKKGRERLLRGDPEYKK